MIRVLIALLVTGTAFSDTVIKYGANYPKPNEPIGGTKTIFVSFQDDWVGPFIKQFEFGGWVDNTGIDGRRSSLLGSASIGIHANAGYLFGQALVGPAIISHKDTALGGHLQFNNDFGFGIQDPKNGNSVGFAYKHVSSAGLYLPNKGRDFLLLRVSLPW